jgi:hypothetical protein
VPFQMLDRVQHRVMFRATRDEMSPACCPTSRQPENGEIVRFRSAAGENQFVRFRSEQIGQLIARVIDLRARFPSRRMNAGRISKMLAQKRQHGFSSRVAKWSGSVVIEVDHSVNPSVSGATLRDRFWTMATSFSS